MSPITNYKIYNAGMKRSMYDKLFWVDKLEPTMIVDFGCGTGDMMRDLQDYFPNVPIVGVDNDPVMAESVKSHTVFSSLDEVVKLSLSKPVKGSTLVLSSVLHELYSYCTPEEIKHFWKLAGKFDNIVIRDMAISDKVVNAKISKASKGFRQELEYYYPKQLKEFEDIWGSTLHIKNYIHFLLKYMYTENWDREVQENYLHNTREDIIKLATQHGHKPIYNKHYTLTYLKDKWEKDIGIKVFTNTHLKLIVSKS